MGKVSIALLLASTVFVIAAFVNGLNTIHDGGSVLTHSYWALAALFAVLGANFFAMFHAAQSDRLIRALRRALLAEREKQGLNDGEDDRAEGR
jgi:predicted Co/Zn/Cd cation transporter (cation efflux family)